MYGGAAGAGHITENLTRFTQQADATNNMTGLTTQSDSGLVMDPDDRDRALEDLKGYKVKAE